MRTDVTGLLIKWKSDADASSEISLWSPRFGLNEIPAWRVQLCRVSLEMRSIKKRGSDERKDVFLLVHHFC